LGTDDIEKNIFKLENAENLFSLPVDEKITNFWKFFIEKLKKKEEGQYESPKINKKLNFNEKFSEKESPEN